MPVKFTGIIFGTSIHIGISIMEHLHNWLSEDILQIMITEIIKENPSQSLNNYVKGIYNYKSKYEKKSQHTCQHEGCKLPSCGSHEISRGIFLNQLADSNDNVYMLRDSFSKNAFELEVMQCKTKYATTFGGYCAEHDIKIFSTFENGDFSRNLHFFQLQALRTIRKEIYLLESHISKLVCTQKELLDANSSRIPPNKLRRLDRIILQRKLELKMHWDYYSKIWSAISSEEEYIYYREFQLPQKKMAFSSAYRIKGKNTPPFLFVFILPGKTNTLVLAASIQHRTYIDSMFHLSDSIFFMSINQRICARLDRLVFSKDYYDNLGEIEKRALARNSDFGNQLAIRLANFFS